MTTAKRDRVDRGVSYGSTGSPVRDPPEREPLPMAGPATMGHAAGHASQSENAYLLLLTETDILRADEIGDDGARTTSGAMS